MVITTLYMVIIFRLSSGLPGDVEDALQNYVLAVM